jgi:negative regulator of replication initiation
MVTPKKRGRGRPATGRDPTLTIRLPKELTARLDAHAKSRGESRSEVMRRFLESGLASEGADTAPAEPASPPRPAKPTKTAPPKPARVIPPKAKPVRKIILLKGRP